MTQAAQPWMQTLSGRAFPLLAPSAADIDFDELAAVLAGVPRFGGHLPGYSVAQHCAVGAKLLRGWDQREAALHFLLHDAHEAFTGDMTTPLVEALDIEAQHLLGEPGLVVETVKRLKARIDVAIFAAAGFSAKHSGAVKRLDLRMLRTERDQLMAPPPAPWADAVEQAEPLPIKLVIWPRVLARLNWLALYRDLVDELGLASPEAAA